MALYGRMMQERTAKVRDMKRSPLSEMKIPICDTRAKNGQLPDEKHISDQIMNAETFYGLLDVRQSVSTTRNLYL